MIYDVSHRTVFDYAQSVSISHHILHLSPRPTPRQRSQRSTIIVEPAATVRSEDQDYFGNPVTRLMLQEPHRRLQVHARGRVEVTGTSEIDLAQSAPWDKVAVALRTAKEPATLEVSEFTFDSPYVTGDDRIFEFALASFPLGRPILAAALDLTARIFRDFAYKGGVTDNSTPAADVLARREGVCQDFAHLEIACLRSLGLPARYVSGYLLTCPPEGKEKLVGSDASHAWVSVWSPGIGWVDFDPTNNLVPGDEHITLAWGRDYGDVSPINGFIVGGGEHDVTVAVNVTPLARDLPGTPTAPNTVA